MKIIIDVKPNAKKEGVEKIADNQYRVRVNAPPVDGQANQAVIDALAKYFGIAKSKVKLLHGEKSKRKIFEII